MALPILQTIYIYMKVADRNYEFRRNFNQVFKFLTFLNSFKF